MKKSNFKSFLTLAVSFFICAYAFAVPEEERIFELKQNIAANDVALVNKLESLSIFLRMPSSWTPEKDKEYRKNGVKSVRGVLAFSCVSDSTPDARLNLSSTYHYRTTMEFADKHNLAVIAWPNFRGYDLRKNAGDYTKEEWKKYNASFEIRTKYWEKAYKRLCAVYNLPEGDTIVYGISGGAQIAHRIVMRYPQYFAGIFMHVSASYDKPTNKVSKVLWFVSSGEADGGYRNAEQFYKQLLDAGCCTIFKAVENLGHDKNEQVEILFFKFYEYLLAFMPNANDPNWKAPPVDKFEMMKYPAYVGDYMNHVAYSPEKAEKNIDRKHMVALPTRPIAEAWGTIIEK